MGRTRTVLPWPSPTAGAEGGCEGEGANRGLLADAIDLAKGGQAQAGPSSEPHLLSAVQHAPDPGSSSTSLQIDGKADAASVLGPDSTSSVLGPDSTSSSENATPGSKLSPLAVPFRPGFLSACIPEEEEDLSGSSTWAVGQSFGTGLGQCSPTSVLDTFRVSLSPGSPDGPCTGADLGLSPSSLIGQWAEAERDDQPRMFRVSLSPGLAGPARVEQEARPHGPAVAAAGLSDSSVDVNRTIASFRDRFRKTISPLLPRPMQRKPRKKRTPPSCMRRSGRIAGRFGAGPPIKRQQKELMIRLGIAREGEIIDDGALNAYLALFEEPLSEQRLTAVLALFGWAPDALPLEAHAEDELVC